ncbi:hypothetical protein O9Z70_12835 [Devosia sp. YIM 151766]|uniref:hypothetical protein n=1 Tax=Devosia sp. YIM 151766 TaxID=3017325 RepID=UPI00255CC862|nr:hypothetical protein [Devosia sp. YIM 151766]WIY52339.1 hypothetical protein O9Z70_12835 [Devosia sp. YIM 151766]
MAEPVSVNRGAGLGYIFTHNGNCFLILPAHVHGRGSRVSIATTAPSAVGDATLMRSFAPELDLSLFYVAPGLDARCQDRFAQLPDDLGALLDGAVTAQLHRVDATGSETRAGMDLTAIDFDTIAATARNTEIYQGTSGAILRIGATPVGMAIQSENVEQATFLRMDEIVARIRRIVTPERRVAIGDPGDAALETTPAQCEPGAIPIRLVTCDSEPPAAELACSNLSTTPPAVAGFVQGSPVRIEIELDVESAVPLRTVTLAAPTSETLATPKAIAVDVSSTRGTPRWNRFGAMDMTPTGQATLTNGARPFASRVAITLSTAWSEDHPLGLSCIRFD